jgi:acyl dehydratase
MAVSLKPISASKVFEAVKAVQKGGFIMVDKNMLGMEFPGPTWDIEKGKIKEFANAIEDPNPIFRDEEAAKAAGLPGIPAPLTFLVTEIFHFDEKTPRPDYKVDLRRILDGGTEYEYIKPVIAGDTITSSTKVTDIYEKKGRRGGTMTFLVAETTYKNQNDEVCVISRGTLIETSQAPTSG